MGTTTRFGLRYPTLTEAPNVPLDMQELATDVDGWLARALPCLSTARPASPAQGLLIFETDTGLLMIWDGDSWNAIVTPAAGGGGGGGTTAHAQFSAAAAQSVATGNVACAFGTTDTASTAVTRATSGAGHQFTLNTSSIWAISATARYASTSATGERYAGIHLPGASGGTPLAGSGSNPPTNNPTTLNVAVTRYFASGTAVIVNLFNGTGSTRVLEPGTGGGWVRINFALVG